MSAPNSLKDVTAVSSFIDGSDVACKGRSLSLLNPFTLAPAFEVSDASDRVVDDAVRAADRAYRAHRRETAGERSSWLERCARALDDDQAALVDLLISDIGKPRRVARIEVQRSSSFVRLCAAQTLLLETSTPTLDATAAGKDHIGFVRRVPYGVVAAITPFNAPVNLMLQKVAPALAAGNAVVAKPHPAGARIATRVAQLFAAAGLPSGLFNVLVGDRAPATALVSNRLVSVITFTGGCAAGDALARAAGAKKFVAELGSNSANIVLKDADLKDAAVRIASAAFEASGQQCVSAQRVIVEHDVVDAFLDYFVAAAAALKVGDPDDETTDVGPVISQESANRIERMLGESVTAGGHYLLALKRSDCTIHPVIVMGADQSAPIWRDEVFGPAVTVHIADSAQHALDLANDSPFGLQGALFTASLDQALWFSQRFDVGSLWVNQPSRFRLDVLPFGGVKQSGFGREGVRYAIEEMSQLTFTGMRMRLPQ